MMDNPLMLAGLLLLGLMALYLVTLLLRQLRSAWVNQRFIASEQRLLRSRIDAALASERASGGGEVGAWSGWRKFVISDKVEEANAICSFYLSPHDGQALPEYFPGQYLTFQLPIPGQNKSVTRCYSLSDAPGDDYRYRVTIKKIPPPPDEPDAPPGLVSNFFHENLNAGDIVDVRAPNGQFILNPEHHGPVVLIAGGIGLTPMLSMLNQLDKTDSGRDTWFYYGVRNSSEHVMAKHLKKLATAHDNFHLRICYSDPLPDDVQGRDFDITGHISVDLFKSDLPSNNYDFFICGPPPMMDAITHGLAEWKVPEERIHFETFGPASAKKVSHASGAVEPVEVEFRRSGKTLTWDGSAANLLEFAESNGLAMESGCRAGNCGTCITAVHEGEVEYMHQPGATVEKGSCLACIAVPKSRLSIDA